MLMRPTEYNAYRDYSIAHYAGKKGWQAIWHDLRRVEAVRNAYTCAVLSSHCRLLLSFGRRLITLSCIEILLLVPARHDSAR
eukprot:7076929-Pyramimonas_sp.AAC.2